jgi:hypothetical protein
MRARKLLSIKIIANGYECETYTRAAKILGCSVYAITQAVNRGRRVIKGKKFWFEGEQEPEMTLGLPGRPCIVDGVRYESVGIAARVVKSKPCALRLALNTKDMFKGYSVSWVDDLE